MPMAISAMSPLPEGGRGRGGTPPPDIGDIGKKHLFLSDSEGFRAESRVADRGDACYYLNDFPGL
jgi:hypothetical protein